MVETEPLTHYVTDASEPALSDDPPLNLWDDPPQSY